MPNRIQESRPLILPDALLKELPGSARINHMIAEKRQEAADILHGKDDRLLVIVGPCSIHDPDAALDYAQHLQPCIERYADELCLIMRVYFEKPRTRLGWNGLINDPKLDGSFNVNQGLRIARQLVLAINQLGVPTGSEFLDTIAPQYIADLTSWSAIGARTSESQIHRQLASGLPMPIGFKNGTSGQVQTAVDAVCAAQKPHHYLGLDQDGMPAVHHTTGNSDCHIILRGSKTTSNYDAASVAAATLQLKQAHLAPRLMVDCSHGNSGKNHDRQLIVIADLSEQLRAGCHHLCGVMMESNLVAGRQDYHPNQALTYGQSITDACIDWKMTEHALDRLSEAVKARRQNLLNTSLCISA